MGGSDYLAEAQLDQQYGIKPRTAQRWRQSGEGPPYIRLGRRRVLYRRQDVENWLRERTYRHRADEFTRQQAQLAAEITRTTPRTKGGDVNRDSTIVAPMPKSESTGASVGQRRPRRRLNQACCAEDA